jgi:hypothetical protein
MAGTSRPTTRPAALAVPSQGHHERRTPGSAKGSTTLGLNNATKIGMPGSWLGAQFEATASCGCTLRRPLMWSAARSAGLGRLVTAEGR